MSQAKLYLLPSTLGSESTKAVIPSDIATMVSDFRFFAVEDIKTARRYLRKLDREFPIDDSTFFVLKNNTSLEELYAMLRPVRDGNNVAVISDAGCPGIADPGANLVALAHQEGVWVAPLVGPSSILLALMGSGFNGQAFTFHGYLPKDRKDRVRKLRDFEASARRTGMTHIFMDTPFRNMHVLEDMLNELSDDTQICIASNLTTYDENIRTMTAKLWRENAYDISKIPTMFLIGKSR